MHALNKNEKTKHQKQEAWFISNVVSSNHPHNQQLHGENSRLLLPISIGSNVKRLHDKPTVPPRLLGKNTIAQHISLWSCEFKTFYFLPKFWPHCQIEYTVTQVSLWFKVSLTKAMWTISPRSTRTRMQLSIWLFLPVNAHCVHTLQALRQKSRSPWVT